MGELDLIPQDYRNWLNQRSMLRQYVILFAVLNVIVLASGGVLAQLSSRATQTVQDLQSQSAITEQQQVQLEQLRAQQAEYERRWSLLRGLRAGAAVEDIFLIIDRALSTKDLWFVDWSFRRAGVVVDGKTQDVETGYFLIVLEDGSFSDDSEWQVETHMTVNGQARDHEALSRFVRALFEQPSIKDVSVQKTALTEYASGRVVEFELTIILNSAIEVRS